MSVSWSGLFLQREGRLIEPARERERGGRSAAYRLDDRRGVERRIAGDEIEALPERRIVQLVRPIEEHGRVVRERRGAIARRRKVHRDRLPPVDRKDDAVRTAAGTIGDAHEIAGPRDRAVGERFAAGGRTP